MDRDGRSRDGRRRRSNPRPRSYPEGSFDLTAGPGNPPGGTYSARNSGAPTSTSLNIDGHQEDYEQRRTAPGRVYEPRRVRHPKGVFKQHFEPHLLISPKEPGGQGIDMAPLQSYVLFYLQSEIVAAYRDLSRAERGTDVHHIVHYIAKRLYKYCDAVRDLEYMGQWAKEKKGKDEDNPFEMHCSRHLERMILTESGVADKKPPPAKDCPTTRTSPLLPGSKLVERRDLEQVSWRKRLMWAIGAVAPIIVPVPLILYVRWTGMIFLAPCIALAIVVAVLASSRNFTTRDVPAITAAYASVLVVFIGTITTPHSVNVAAP